MRKETELMEKKRSFYNLDVTLEQAEEQLKKLDPAKIAPLSGTKYDQNESAIIVPFLSQEHRVLFPSASVVDLEGNRASTYTAILILHYLVTAKGTPLTGEWISYRHLPGGDIYMDPFQKRAVMPFLKTFGDKPEDFKKAAIATGAQEGPGSGISMVFTVLPRVPICFVIWPGDDEMPSSANILFDAAAADYMPTEDYAHLPAIVNGAMKKKLG